MAEPDEQLPGIRREILEWHRNFPLLKWHGITGSVQKILERSGHLEYAGERYWITEKGRQALARTKE